MNTEILEEFSASNDHTIVKGKRTKRPRPSSSASSSGGDLNSTSLLSSPTTTTTSSTSTDEDEDLANCLILLARGAHGPKTDRAQSKFSSRKVTETAVAPDGRAAIYVYECKTCCRSFPSFQALGGHRASHKKPKPAAADSDHKRSPPPPPKKQQKEEDKEEEEAKFANLNTIPPPPSTQLLRHLENKPKIHECSICGSEFASGQALGGHMRRHRSGPNSSTPPPPAAVEVAAKSDDDSSSHDHHHRVVEKTRNMLSLDLNLPAPPEDDRREAEFRAFSSNQQPRLMFAAAALVDCHY